MNIKSMIDTIKKTISPQTLGNPYSNRGGKTQRDNKFHPSGTCNFTAAANALDCLQIDILDKYKKKFSEYNQTEDILSVFSESAESLKHFKKSHPWFDPLRSESRPRHFSQHVAWCVNMLTSSNVARWGEYKYDYVVDMVQSGNPVVISGKFTSFGHFILLKGMTPDRNFFWVDDSWGDYITKYKEKNGHNILYESENVMELCWQKKIKHPCIIFTKQNEEIKK